MKRSLFERIKIYQEKHLFHPLTCRIDSCRADLEPLVQNDSVVLSCPSCGEFQTFIPPMFLDEDFDNVIDSQIAMLDNFQKIIQEAEENKKKDD